MISSGRPSWRSNLIEISPSLVESCRLACSFSVQDWWKIYIGGGKIVSATLEARNGRFDPFFLQISQIIYLQMENFVFAILYLVYFALKYMYFEDLSRISENGGYLSK